MQKRFPIAVQAVALCLFAPCLISKAEARWTSVGPFGGNAEVIASSVMNPSLLLAGTKNANLFISRNAGESWEALAFPRQYSAMLHTLAIDPRNTSIFYAAISDEPRPCLYRSMDAGVTWEPVKSLAKEEVYSLAFSVSDPNVMAAGLRHSVWLSRDAGVSWKAISPSENVELQPVVSVAFDPKDSSVIYAGTPRLPWRTTDAGEHWDLIAEGMSTDSDIITVRVDASRPSRVFIGACSGFWHSRNKGGLWAKFGGIPFTSRRTYAFIQDPRNPDLIYAGTSRGLYRTRDGGSEWKSVALHEIKSLAISQGALYVATADAGLFKSVDQGETLKPINEGFTSRNFSPISEAGEHLYAGTRFEVDAGAVYASSDTGSHWEQIAQPSQLGYENVSAVVRGLDGTLVVATQSALFRSTDVGKTWDRVNTASPTVHVTALVAVERALLAASDKGLYRSVDAGLSWWRVGDTREPVRGLFHSGVTYAVLSKVILVSRDGGETWVDRHLPFFAESHDVAAAGEIVLAGTSRGLFRSEDAGETWYAAKSGLPLASVQVVAIDPVTKSLAFAFEYGNFYQSQDAGNTWRRYEGEGLGGAAVKSFAITTQRPRHLLAVTATRGIFVSGIDEKLTPGSSFSAVQLRKDQYVPNQQNDKTPAF